MNGIQDANDYGVTCPQAMYNGQPGVSFETQSKLNVTEDCLTLTVYSPIGATEESKLPVVVYLHGGGYSLGDHRFDHPQSYLELAKNDVVSVVINYRLGIFGFLAGEDVKRDGDLNAGMLVVD